MLLIESAYICRVSQFRHIDNGYKPKNAPAHLNPEISLQSFLF